MTYHRQQPGIYLHIPFCRALCTYCAFNTYAGLDSLIEPYVDAICREIEKVGKGRSDIAAQTLYFGGGTPSLLTAKQVNRIVETVCQHLGLQVGAEITLEANPGSADLDTLQGYREAGINRLSLGVQSSQPGDLRLFGRRHTFEEAHISFVQARQAGFEDISLDLIYGAMGQTLDGWLTTLEAVLAWNPDHFSLYSLILEPGTSLHRRVERGTLPAPSDDLTADMYEATIDRLEEAGYDHYEISSWGKPGHHSQHNRIYWLNEPFLGLGAGAHGAAPLANGRMVRYWCVNKVSDYIKQVRSGSCETWPLGPAVGGYEVIDSALEMSETAILNLRLLQEGINKAAFEQRFGVSVEAIFGEVLAELADWGLLANDSECIQLTRRGYLLSNQVFMRLLPDPV